MSDTFKVAAIQMLSEPEVEANLAAAGNLIAEAARQGARLVSLPEYFCIFGKRERDKVEVRERDGSGPIQRFLSDIAREYGLWIVGGSVPLDSSDPDKVMNSCLVYNDRGERVARYDKIHMFGYATETERFHESGTIEPGTATVAIDSPFGRLALSICYDVRFPELYRRLAREGRILAETCGNNTDAAINFVTRLDRDFLISGYRDLMRELYAPKNYYRRIRAFLRTYRPGGPSMRLSGSDVKAFLKSLWVLGVWHAGRRAYWGFFWSTLLASPRKFQVAMELSILGHHFRRMASRL